MSLTREQILGLVDLEVREVSVPEWDGVVHVRELTAAEAAQFDDWMYSNKDKPVEVAKGFSAFMVLLAACTSDGKRLFTDDDLDAVKGKNPHAIARIADAALELNRMRKKDLEAEAKKSESGQTNVSCLSSAQS